MLFVYSCGSYKETAIFCIKKETIKWSLYTITVLL